MASAIETLLMSARAPGPRGSSDPAAAARDVVASLKPAADARSVAIEFVPPAGSLRVGADREQVAQALAPLLDNAISHARSRVSVSLGAHNGQVTIAVQDDGEGVKADSRDAMFEPGSSTRGGAGLGLPLARRMARSCGGDVTVADSEAGARFELSLPGSTVVSSSS
jgi:signal transduction histidine kinase